MHLLIFAVINLLAALLSGAAGGGGGLISVPVLVLLGLSPTNAIATGKFGGLGISAGTSLRFGKEKITDKRTVVLFSVISAGGGVLGSLLLVHYQQHEKILQDIVGYSILLVGVPMLYLKNMGIAPADRSAPVRALGLALLTAAVVLQAALGSGLGSLQLVILISCFGMTALVASATRRAMQLTVAVISLVILIAAGLVDYEFGLVALLTSFGGGYIGAHVAIKRGNRFVVNLFAAASLLLAVQLIWR